MNASSLTPQSILETCLYARDLQNARRFYKDVMGLEVAAEEPGRHLFFRMGEGMFLLFNPDQTEQPPAHGVASEMDIPPRGAGHVAFQVPAESIPRWRAHFDSCGVQVEREIQWPHQGCSLFVRDPAENSVEVATPGIWRWTES